MNFKFKIGKSRIDLLPILSTWINKEASWLHAELFLCWIPCGFLKTTWYPCRNYMVSKFGTTWCPCGTMEMTWKQKGNCQIYSFQADFKSQLRQDMETMWFPLETTLFPPIDMM